jgi:hypothetical protein
MDQVPWWLYVVGAVVVVLTGVVITLVVVLKKEGKMKSSVGSDIRVIKPLLEAGESLPERVYDKVPELTESLPAGPVYERVPPLAESSYGNVDAALHASSGRLQGRDTQSGVYNVIPSTSSMSTEGGSGERAKASGYGYGQIPGQEPDYTNIPAGFAEGYGQVPT